MWLHAKEPDWDSERYKKTRLHYISQFVFGESMAMDYSREMSAFAPTSETRDFLSVQSKEEEHHATMFTDVLSGDAQKPRAVVPHLMKLHELMEDALKKKNWAQALFIQNIAIEGLVLVLFKELRKHSDETLAHIFDIAIRDEEKHVAFGISEMKKIFEKDKEGAIKKEIRHLQRKVMYHSALIFRDVALEAGDLGVAWDELAEIVIRDNLRQMHTIGLKLPILDRIFYFFGVKLFAWV